ncbi:MAG: hypothetical protein ACD_86C00003G0018 [uncultured bacterium]|nr:MAG: hypothetical protein ACD_86C00003G0018 [uncultured bacterium]
MPKGSLLDSQMNKIIESHIESPLPNNQTITISTESLKDLMGYCYSLGRDVGVMRTQYKLEPYQD